jgi:hypothetical protein
MYVDTRVSNTSFTEALPWFLMPIC